MNTAISKFLLSNKNSRETRNSFEIEKMDTRNTFVVKFLCWNENVQMEICKATKMLKITIECYIDETNRMDIQFENEVLQFELPDFVETEGCYFNQYGHEHVLVFGKKFRYPSGACYY